MPGPHSAPLVSVDGAHGHLAHPISGRGEQAEQVVGVAVARPELVERQRRSGPRRERREAALAVVNGQPGGRARQRGERAAGEAPPAGHPASVGMGEAIALHVLGAPMRHGADDGLEIRGSHLVVAGHDGQNVRAAGDRVAVPGDDGRSHAAIFGMPHHRHPPIAQARYRLRRPVPARIVHHDDRVDPRRHARDDAPDEPLLVECRHDHRDDLAVQHGAPRIPRRALRASIQRGTPAIRHLATDSTLVQEGGSGQPPTMTDLSVGPISED